MSYRRFVLAAALATCAFAVPTSAQACGPDGLTLPGACCAPVAPTLPAFPSVSFAGQGNCISSCTPSTPFGVNITISNPSPFFCDTYLFVVSITGTVNVSGLLVGKYVRTWDESTTAGTTRQIWRFIVNGDLNYVISPGSTTPCPVPKIALAGRPVNFYGAIDYARDCGTTIFTASFSASHLCGAFEHASWSPQPISPDPNPDTVYAFVGPLPFVWAAPAPPQGVLLGDSVRSTNYSFGSSPAVWQCLSEQAELGGQLVNVAQYCPCANAAVPPGPAQWTQQKLNFQYGTCAAPGIQNWAGIPVPPLVPTGLSAIPIGTWVLPPATFPNNRSLHHYFGLASAPDPCIGSAFPFHIANGVMTSNGPLGNVIPPPPGVPFTSTNFLDLENTLILISGPPFVTIGFGGIFLASQVWSVNL